MFVSRYWKAVCVFHYSSLPPYEHRSQTTALEAPTSLLGLGEVSRGQLKCAGTRAETRFRLSAERSSPFKSAGGRQFSRLLAAEVCASAVVMLDTPCSEVVWRVLATQCIRQFPLSLPLPCVTVCHHISTGVLTPVAQCPPLEHTTCERHKRRVRLVTETRWGRTSKNKRLHVFLSVLCGKITRKLIRSDMVTEEQVSKKSLDYVLGCLVH